MKIVDDKFKFSSKLKDRDKTEFIIFHHCAGNLTAKQVHEEHLRKGWAGIGYHFYIDKDGTVHKGRDIGTVGAHTIGLNDKSIAICFQGNFENEYPTEKQYTSAIALVIEISKKYGELTCKCHRDFNATACPGKFFNLDVVMKGVNKVDKYDGVAKAHKEACEWAVNNGIIKGNGVSYAWDKNVNKAQLMTILYRFYKFVLDRKL